VQSTPARRARENGKSGKGSDLGNQGRQQAGEANAAGGEAQPSTMRQLGKYDSTRRLRDITDRSVPINLEQW
jgi:hypothetical protein